MRCACGQPLTQLLMTRSPGALANFATPADLLQAIDSQAAALHEDGPDPFDWCHQTWAYDAHDLGTTPPFAGDTTRRARVDRGATRSSSRRPSTSTTRRRMRAPVADAVPHARFVALPGGGRPCQRQRGRPGRRPR